MAARQQDHDRRVMHNRVITKEIFAESSGEKTAPLLSQPQTLGFQLKGPDQVRSSNLELPAAPVAAVEGMDNRGARISPSPGEAQIYAKWDNVLHQMRLIHMPLATTRRSPNATMHRCSGAAIDTP